MQEELINELRIKNDEDTINPDVDIDWSKVKDMYDEDDMMDEIEEQGIKTRDDEKPEKRARGTDNKRLKKMREK